MGLAGKQLVINKLAQLKAEYKPQVVVAQAENVTNGKGCSLTDYLDLKSAGVDFMTGGNWSLWDETIIPALNDLSQPIIRPANLPLASPGLDYKYLETSFGPILFVSLLGQIVGRFAEAENQNPLLKIDQILADNQLTKLIIVNFHGDFSSEKVVIGHYLDSKVSMVVGDHWHVPTNDGRILAGGTAHITDVGMVGTLNSSLGIKKEIIIDRWRNNQKNNNQLENNGPFQLNGFLVDIDKTSGLASYCQSVNKIYN